MMDKKGEEGIGFSLSRTGEIILIIVGLILMLIIIYTLSKKILA